MPQWANHIAIRSTYIVDPNGISLELSYDTPGFQPDPVEAERLLDALPEGFEGEEQTGTGNAPAG